MPASENALTRENLMREIDLSWGEHFVRQHMVIAQDMGARVVFHHSAEGSGHDELIAGILKSDRASRLRGPKLRFRSGHRGRRCEPPKQARLLNIDGQTSDALWQQSLLREFMLRVFDAHKELYRHNAGRFVIDNLLADSDAHDILIRCDARSRRKRPEGFSPRSL